MCREEYAFKIALHKLKSLRIDYMKKEVVKLSVVFLRENVSKFLVLSLDFY